MQKGLFETEQEMYQSIADEMETLLRNKKSALICIAAGNTSLGLFQELILRCRAGRISFSDSWFVAMDEWMGMNASVAGSCSDFLNRNFLSQVDFRPERIRLVDGMAGNPEQECDEIREFIEKHGGIDYLVLGCGMNGHLALNEPGVSLDSSVHTTRLDPITQKVGQKYFSGRTADLHGGITIGIREIRGAKRTVLALNGEGKQEILKKIMDSPVTMEIPATIIKDLPNGCIVYDRKAGGLL